jgi:hypothetical protein
MRVRVQLCLAVLATTGLLTACSGAPPAAAPPPAPAATTGPTDAAKNPVDMDPTAMASWSCDTVANAPLGSSTVPYEPAGQPITLSNGGWSNEEGSIAQIKSCVIGDFDGTGPDDAIAAVEFTPIESNAEYWTLGVWHDTAGVATFVTLFELGDRNPVETLQVNGSAVTVVWDTRGPSDPMTALTIRRTSVFTLKAGVLTETSRTDAPFAG